jgi:hypothetical protein
MLAGAEPDERITAVAAPIFIKESRESSPSRQLARKKRTAANGKAWSHVCINVLIKPGSNDNDRMNMD